ncbi:Detected protein of unknown function [Hibiscus syriacus]|uniref:Uncharacterized protein n=1 Tax=Hibiscus syriacus TaxID=106335 RepID=A0A6A3BZA2_HIBSY|nr:Detected protein of unknown function [Hibiscus syriacus]
MCSPSVVSAPDDPSFAARSFQWEPSPVTDTLTEKAGENCLEKSSELFETLPESKDEVSVTNAKDLTDTTNQPVARFLFLKWPLWLLDPSLLLDTGMVQTLLPPTSATFYPICGSIGSLHSASSSESPIWLVTSAVYEAYRVLQLTRGLKLGVELNAPKWMMHTIRGLVCWLELVDSSLPLQLMLDSNSHWYAICLNVLWLKVFSFPDDGLELVDSSLPQQLMLDSNSHWYAICLNVLWLKVFSFPDDGGLKLGVELNAPEWMMHTIRGLVCWWVLILGVQLMRVSWFAVFKARARRQQSSATTDA